MKVGSVVILFFTLLGCWDTGEEAENNGSTSPTREKKAVETNGPTSESMDTSNIDTIATRLNEPWEIVQFGEAFYISERVGSIAKISNGKMTRKPVKQEKSLADRAEAGLLGIAFPDSFEEDNKAFAYYSYSRGNEVFQRIVTIKEQAEQWVETEVLLDEIPGGQFHQGGRIEIGPDDKLYATTGDATQPELAQDKGSIAGKILRMNLNGTVPEDNPLEDSLVYTWGHRNPQGLAWDDAGRLYATEHGDQSHDEINVIESGHNYGWPEIQANETKEGMKKPIIYSTGETWAPTGMAFHQETFYFASLRGEALRRFNLEEETQEVEMDGFGRIRDVLSTDDGLYVITNNTDGRGSPEKTDDRLLYVPVE